MNLSYLDGPADGSAWSRGICSSRMTRGGSWFTGTKEIRLPARFNLKTGDRNDFTGSGSCERWMTSQLVSVQVS